jgi:hypothetical protein
LDIPPTFYEIPVTGPDCRFLLFAFRGRLGMAERIMSQFRLWYVITGIDSPNLLGILSMYL